MVDIKIGIEVSVRCDKCNGDLYAEFDQGRDIIKVDLCGDCLEAKYKEGVSIGILHGKR